MPQILPLPSSIIHRFQVPVKTATVAGVPIPAAEVELQRVRPPMRVICWNGAVLGPAAWHTIATPTLDRGIRMQVLF
jgi:hypothetical protein